MTDSVYKVIELVGSSPNSWEEAAKNAFEKEFVQRKLVQYNNNVSKTAEAIGVKPSYLHKKLKNMP